MCRELCLRYRFPLKVFHKIHFIQNCSFWSAAFQFLNNSSNLWPVLLIRFLQLKMYCQMIDIFFTGSCVGHDCFDRLRGLKKTFVTRHSLRLSRDFNRWNHPSPKFNQIKLENKTQLIHIVFIWTIIIIPRKLTGIKNDFKKN